MSFVHDSGREEFKPRLLVWQLHPESDPRGNGSPAPKSAGSPPGVFTTRECMLTLDSIAGTAKPIMVLTGAGLVMRSDMYQIVEYGTALGMKMIVEAPAEDLTEDIIRQFASFGPRIFRILVGDSIVEDMHTRYRQSPSFRALEQTVKRLNESGLEVHLVVHLNKPDVRALAFDHDYALRHSARGLYCHLAIESKRKKDGPRYRDAMELDRFIEEIAVMKTYSPDHMYFSPQCVKYGHRPQETDRDTGRSPGRRRAEAGWQHWCLAGRTYAFIAPDGAVKACATCELICGNLRENEYNFKSIWEDSETFALLRQEVLSCSSMRLRVASSPTKP